MKIKYKYRFVYLLILLCYIFYVFIPVITYANEDIQDVNTNTSNILNVTCVTTGYYSPKQNQRAYFQYDFESEKKLNGNGTHGADGTPVYLGMIAADKSIPFGSYVYIENVGLFKVHDRGGAIKNKDDNYRFDIWMGKGEEGMVKALMWGVRRNNCTIYLPNAKVSKNIVNTGLVWEGINQKQIDGVIAKLNERKKENVILATEIKDNPEIENIKKMLNVEKPLKYNDKSEQVYTLNKYLKLAGYDVNDTDEYDYKTYAAVIDFQIKNNIVKTKNDFGAGYFGIKTSKIFVSAVIDIVNKSSNSIQNIAQINSINNTEKIKSQEEINYIILANMNENKIDKIVVEKYENENKENKLELKFNLTLGMQNDDVIKLQQMLIKLGYLKREIATNYFDLEVSESVFAYQKANNIVYQKTDYGAGWVGPKTRKHLNKEVIGDDNDSIKNCFKVVDDKVNLRYDFNSGVLNE